MVTRLVVPVLVPVLTATHGNELDVLVAALHEDALHEADARREVFVLHLAGIEWAEVLRLQHVAERPGRHGHGLDRAQHLRLVLGVAGVVLLLVHVTGPRVSLHDDAGPGAVYSGLPGAVA